MTDIGAAWMAAGTITVMLPSEMQVKVEETSVPQLMVRGVFPSYLRSMADQFMGDGVDPSKLDAGETAKWKEMVALLARHMVREVALPGSDDFAPYMLTPEQVNDDDPRMPRVDLEALQHMVLHLRSPREVDATSRLAAMHRQMTTAIERGASNEEIVLLRTELEVKAAEYNRIAQKEAAESLFGWATFRGIGQRPDGGDQRPDVEDPPVQPADHLESGGRPRPRRRSRRAPAGGSADAVAK